MTAPEKEHEENIPQASEVESLLHIPENDITNKGDGAANCKFQDFATEIIDKGDEAADSKCDNLKDYSLWKRLEVDKPYRRRFIHTVWLFWAFIGLGWTVSQIGPSFPDLMYIVQKELDVASWLFTVTSVGYLTGSLIGGILYDRFNKLLLIFFSIVIMAIGSAFMPWCTSFPLMLAFRFINGLGAGGLDTGGNADLVSLWDEEGRSYMQALHFCFGIGGIVSPLVTEPFLAKKTCLSDAENTSYILPNNMSLTVMNTSASPQCQEVFGKTYVQYAYLITCILTLTSAVPFLVIYINSLGKKSTGNMQADKSNQKRPEKLPLQLKVIFLCLLAFMMMVNCAIEDTFSGFLMTFCLRHLGWSKEEGSYATSIHWTAFSVGRFAGIFLIKRFSPVKLLFTFCVLLICSFSALLIASITMTTSFVWVCVPMVGFSMSVIFPCIFTWTEESILEVTGMVSSLFLISACTGVLINPLLLGYLMDNFAPITFTYLFVAQSCIVFSVLVTIFLLAKQFIKPRVKFEKEIKVENKSLGVMR